MKGYEGTFNGHVPRTQCSSRIRTLANSFLKQNALAYWRRQIKKSLNNLPFILISFMFPIKALHLALCHFCHFFLLHCWKAETAVEWVFIKEFANPSQPFKMRKSQNCRQRKGFISLKVFFRRKFQVSGSQGRLSTLHSIEFKTKIFAPKKAIDGETFVEEEEEGWVDKSNLKSRRK